MTSTGRAATHERSLEPWRSLALLAVLTALAVLRSGPPAAKPADAPLSEFSGARARETLERVLGATPESSGAPASRAQAHPVGTSAHERVRERLVSELERIGLAVETQEAFVAGPHSNAALVRNVMARIRGRESRPALMLTAHYDSVAAGSGAGDDGAGVAALLEIARVLTFEAGSGDHSLPSEARSGDPSLGSLGRDVILLFTDGEELGLLGARAFCREHPWAKDAALVINLEGRGTCGPSEMFETSDDNAELMRLFARSVPRPSAVSLAYEVYKRMPNDTDMTVFKAAGMSGFNFAFIGGSRRYHTALDDLAHLDAGSLQHHGDNALALVRALGAEGRPLATADARASRASDRAVYADVLGFVFVHWPAKWAVPIALAELLACAWCAIRLCRSRACAWSSVGAGMFVAVAALCAAAGVGWIAKSACSAVSKYPEPWAGRLPTMAACLTAGTLCTTLLACSIARVRRIGVGGAWIGAWLLLMLAGTASAIALPSASYLFAIPGALAASTCLFGALSPVRFPALLERGWATLPLFATAIVWIPLAIALERAIEYRVALANAAVIGVVLAVAAPSWMSAPRRRVQVLACAAGISSVIALACLAFGAAGSASEPGPLSFARVIDADRREERWLASSSGWPLPSAVRDAGSFELEVANPFRWWSYDSEVHASPVRPSRIAVEDIAPQCRVSDPASESASNGATTPARELRVSIRSQRGARGLMVRASKGAEIRAATLHGRTLAVSSGAALGIVGAGAEPIELVIAVEKDAAAELEIADGMPLEVEESEAWVRARPETFVPRGEGDVSIVVRRFALGR